MTETTTRQRGRKDTPAPDAATPDAPTPDATPIPEAATPAAATPSTRSKAPDTSKIAVDAINGATLAAADLLTASAPVRERSTEQKAMDRVAARAYAAWIEAKRPSQWAKIPVVTYFLAPEDVSAYRYLIRRACAIVEPAGDSVGVRVRWGNMFTLSEAMAEKIGRKDDAGKTVLAWAAVDKREANKTSDTAAQTPATEENQPQVQG